MNFDNDDIFDYSQFDPKDVQLQLEQEGMVSIPLFKSAYIKYLAEYARAQFADVPHDEAKVVGSYGVRQQLSQIFDLVTDGPVASLSDKLCKYLNSSFSTLETFPFETPIDLNTVGLVRYDAGSLGITPHRDPELSQNLVIILVLEGKGWLCRCDDRQGSNSREIKTSPGTLILMRAPGFLPNGNDRPFHYITNITETRYTATFRQYKEKPSWI